MPSTAVAKYVAVYYSYILFYLVESVSICYYIQVKNLELRDFSGLFGTRGMSSFVCLS